jgi:hypothetical protein
VRRAGWFLACVVACGVTILAGWLIRSKFGEPTFTSWGVYLTGAGTVILAVAALATGLQAINEYRDRTASEHTRWVFSLFQQFFQDQRYKAMRRLIDYDDLEEIAPLMERDLKRDREFNEQERNLLDGFTDFLNFFEMVAYLGEQKQVAANDIRQVFDYYLRRMTEIRRAGELREYLRETGFEKLYRLLLEYSHGHKA